MDEDKVILLPGVEGVQQIPMGKLVLIELAGISDGFPLQSIRPLNRSHVNTLAATDHTQWPPLEVVHIQDRRVVHHNDVIEDAFIIIDGKHRYTAGNKKRLSSIQCHIGSYTSIDAVIGQYLISNMKHGIPANKKARLTLVLWMYDYDSTLSPDEIASVTGLPTSIVKKTIDAAMMDSDLSVDRIAGETPSMREARLLVHAVVRFVNRQSELNSRFIELAEYDENAEDAGEELLSYLDTVRGGKLREMKDGLRVVKDIIDFVQTVSSK